MANYQEIQRRFWKMQREQPLSAQEIALYQYLLNVAASRKWEEPLALSNREICLVLGIAESTLCRTRAKLKERGLIEFNPGITKRQAPIYYLQKKSNRASNCLQNESNNESNKTDYLQNKSNNADCLQNESNNESINSNAGNNIYNISCVSVNNARARFKILTDQELLDYFFNGNLSVEVEALCKQLNTTIEVLRETALEVLNDWKLAGEQHADSIEQKKHFVNHLRAKITAKQRGATPRSQSGSRTNSRDSRAPRNVSERWANFKLPPECIGN